MMGAEFIGVRPLPPGVSRYIFVKIQIVKV
jgi:hypothetical protein